MFPFIIHLWNNYSIGNITLNAFKKNSKFRSCFYNNFPSKVCFRILCLSTSEFLNFS